MRILVTEDDSVTRRVLSLFLSPHGQVDVAATGKEAMERFNKAHETGDAYALVCLDIGLPDRPGLDILRDMREWEQKHGADPVIVIMLTGASDHDHIEAARELGATKYLLKPVIELELIENLRQLGLVEPS